MSKLPFTHLTYPERRPVTALTIPHRHNEGTRLVLDEHERVVRLDDRDLQPIGIIPRR